MGIAGFYLWLQRYYYDCVEQVPEDAIYESSTNRPSIPIDNLYLDMNGLIHPCCHDTSPKPEPETEEEMFDRIFEQIEKLVRVVKPRKTLVMAIDGVAPRSKMNQQRSRRFKAAQEREESDKINRDVADYVVKEHDLPRPHFRDRWDHNVITPSTAFMERVGAVIEWFVMKKLNEDPTWKFLNVIFSDAHVCGEGEHKIMHYIRGLRAQPGYNPNTTHCIYGMDADLICLGLSTHEPNFSVLRNNLSETFQPAPDSFCYFHLGHFREHLKKDFENIPDMDFERVIDDFIFLCFFVGNDFLPHLPMLSIKTKGIELMLDHYVRDHEDHGYLTRKGEVKFKRLAHFLNNFIDQKYKDLIKEYRSRSRAAERAKSHVQERVGAAEDLIRDSVASLAKDRSNAQVVSNKLLVAYSNIQKEQARFVAGKEPLSFSYLSPVAEYRREYYTTKFHWDPEMKEKEFEDKVSQVCKEYLRGVQWVMRYYTKGCPSWEWYYPFHYAPLIQDLSEHTSDVNVDMRIGEPLHPVNQLLAVLPRESVEALPEELHDAVKDETSILARFYPETFHVDITEALFAYQGVIQLPFINCNLLKKASEDLVTLEPDEGSSLLYTRNDTVVAKEINRVLDSARDDGLPSADVPIPMSVARVCPIAGRIGKYANAWPLEAKIECPDSGLAEENPRNIADDIKENRVNCYAYDFNIHADYDPRILNGARNLFTEKQEKKDAGKRRREDSGRGGGGRGADEGVLKKPRREADNDGVLKKPIRVEETSTRPVVVETVTTNTHRRGRQ